MKRDLYENLQRALRSKQYKKIEGALCELNEDGSYGFCVQGVLCDLMDNTRWKKTLNGEVLGYDFGEYGINNGVIPNEVLSCMNATFLDMIPDWNDGGEEGVELSYIQIANKLKKAVEAGHLSLED